MNCRLSRGLPASMPGISDRAIAAFGEAVKVQATGFGCQHRSRFGVVAEGGRGRGDSKVQDCGAIPPREKRAPRLNSNRTVEKVEDTVQLMDRIPHGAHFSIGYNAKKVEHLPSPSCSDVLPVSSTSVSSLA